MNTALNSRLLCAGRAPGKFNMQQQRTMEGYLLGFARKASWCSRVFENYGVS